MKKREDGAEIRKEENPNDGRLSSINWARNKGHNHYTTVNCAQCKKPGKASNMRAYPCFYKSSSDPEGPVHHGELPFCSYECTLDWFNSSQIAGPE